MPPHEFESLQRSGPPLGTLAAGRIMPALSPALARALQITRAERDRLVIFDPSVAPLIRPLVDATDVVPWHVGAARRWIIAVPMSRAADLGARHPHLARFLEGLPVPSGVASGDPWWALPSEIAHPVTPPHIIVAGVTVAWNETGGFVGGPATVIAAADPYWLGLLGSAIGRRLLSNGVAVEAFPVPDAPEPARASLAGLALSAATLAVQIDDLERAVLKRLVADFGPPGVQPGPRLRRWWELSFAALHEAVREELRNDIPERYRPTWEAIHRDEQTARAEAIARLADIEQAIDAQAAAIFGLPR